ncbi:MAG TPA: tRNA dihydrouridine synthase DusB [Bacteroidales bacterium]|nr:tRNA dihydrouridine synthase DusB [Bacteroidales bacterium]HQI46504.1 tRNA dihydrouridine synthase DusB [Bacteroidales bacterium]
MLKIGSINLPSCPLMLAPMEDITDPAFRAICRKYGADLMYTEFISSEGLIRDAIKSIRKLNISDFERPIGIQIFGHDINSMKKAAELAEAAQPDLIDINFGCPVRKVVSKGAGAALLKDINRMIEMTKVVVQSTSLPVTVKTRLGWDEKSKIIAEIAEQLQDTGIKALSIHARTRSQIYSGIADWTLIGEIKNNPRITIPIFGNGDIDSPKKALEMKEKYKVDGLMIGRASIGNPWIFKQVKEYLINGNLIPEPDLHERIAVCKEHLLLSVKEKGERSGILEMRKHFKGYFKGVKNIKEYKISLLQTPTLPVTIDLLEKIENTI